MKYTVLVSNSMYKNMKKECRRNGSTKILNKFNEESTVTLQNGKLIDDDGERQVISQKMLKEMSNGRDSLYDFGDKMSMNSVMRKVLKECHRQGLSSEQGLQIYLQNMRELTEMFKDYENIDEVEFNLTFINKNNRWEVN
jgi:hypothetical protein